MSTAVDSSIPEILEEREVTRAAQTMSIPAFAAIWDKPEDDIYDACLTPST